MSPVNWFASRVFWARRSGFGVRDDAEPFAEGEAGMVPLAKLGDADELSEFCESCVTGVFE